MSEENIFGSDPSSSTTYIKDSFKIARAGLPIERWNKVGDFGKWQWKMKSTLRKNGVHAVVYAPEDLDPEISARELFEMKEWAFTTLQ